MNLSGIGFGAVVRLAVSACEGTISAEIPRKSPEVHLA